MTPPTATATLQEQQRGEAVAHALDQLRRGKSAIAAGLHNEEDRARITALTQAYDLTERAMRELETVR